MNSIKIHVKDKNSIVAVNGAEIGNVLAYEVKHDGEHWGARVRLDFIADGEIDLDINQTDSPQ